MQKIPEKMMKIRKAKKFNRNWGIPISLFPSPSLPWYMYLTDISRETIVKSLRFLTFAIRRLKIMWKKSSKAKKGECSTTSLFSTLLHGAGKGTHTHPVYFCCKS